MSFFYRSGSSTIRAPGRADLGQSESLHASAPGCHIFAQRDRLQHRLPGKEITQAQTARICCVNGFDGNSLTAWRKLAVPCR